MNITAKKYLLLLLACMSVSLWQHKDHIFKDIQGIHSWRQSQTMWNVRNFVRHDANILNPRISSFNGGKDNLYRYEFPIMQWSIAMVQRVLGEKIAIVRIMIFLIGICTTIGFFFLAHHLTNNWLTSFLTAILFHYTPVFFYYTINPIPDNLALCGGVWYIYYILKYFNSEKIKHLILASIFLLLATLAKLPFLMFSILSIIYFVSQIIRQKKLSLINLQFACIQATLLIPAFAWYLWVMPHWTGNPILHGIMGESFSINNYLSIIYYHITEMFPNILLSMPVWPLFAIGLYILISKKHKTNWIFSLISITFLYLILELNAIGTAHDYYMFPFLPWLFLIIALGIDFLRNHSPKMIYILATICIWSCWHTHQTTYAMWSIEQSYFNKDVFLHSDDLKNAIPANQQCIILNDVSNYIFSYRIDKMGHIFKNDLLPIAWIEDMIKNYNIKYMYSDSQKLNNNPALVPYINKILMTRGSIKVFELKIPDKQLLTP